MIKIITRNGSILRYRGTVKLYRDDRFLHVEADGTVDFIADFSWSNHTYDMIFLSDVISIEGELEPTNPMNS